MPLKLRPTHLAAPAYAHLQEYAVILVNWQIGSIWEERQGKGWGWALSVYTVGLGLAILATIASFVVSQTNLSEAPNSGRSRKKSDAYN